MIDPIRLKDNFNIIEYWNSLIDCPLKQFAHCVVATPGSNCSIKRLFSYSTLIEDKKRGKSTIGKKSMLLCDI